MSGFKTSGFKTSGFKRLKHQVYKMSDLQNIRSSKRPVSKTSGFKTSLLVNISKRLFSKKNTDLTYVMDCIK